MIILSKIISGGQTGVDQGALRAAIDLGMDCGGWCPPGRESEGGKIPEQFPLKETPSERSKKAPEIPRSLRTEWNVRDSEATLVLQPAGCKDTGTEWTVQCAEMYHKHYLIIDPYKSGEAVSIREWLDHNRISILNVAGPSEKSYPGIGEVCYMLLSGIFE